MSIWLRVVLFALGFSAWAACCMAQQPPKIAGVPDVCLRENGRLIYECPHTCGTACRNPAVNRGREMAEACDHLYRAAIASPLEPQMCNVGAIAQATPPAAPTAPLPSNLPLPALKPVDHVQTIKSCLAQYPGVMDSQIPVAKEAQPPACFVSAMNMKCRFDSLADRGRAFNARLQRIRDRSYSNLKGDSMCKVNRGDVEGDYGLSQSVQAPLAQLQKDFKEELGCLSQYEASLTARPCGQEGEACDVRKQSIREVLEQRLGPSRAVAGQAAAALATAETAVKDITSFWAGYKDICF